MITSSFWVGNVDDDDCWFSYRHHDSGHATFHKKNNISNVIIKHINLHYSLKTIHDLEISVFRRKGLIEFVGLEQVQIKIEL